MLKIPSYITDSGVCGSPVQYSWKADQDVRIRDTYSKNIEQTVQKIALRPTLALGIAIGEWMVWRLDGLSPYKRARQYVEALWARTIDESYLKVDHLEPEKDTGTPTIGPLLALEHALYLMLVNTIYDEPDRGKSIAQLAALVRYTLTDTAAFDTWLKKTLQVLVKNFETDPDDPGGPILPRAFFVLGAIDLKESPRLLDEQLKNTDHKGNPFLASPTEIRKSGFSGTPYRYEI
jgi:hypothetical protein